MSLHPCPRCDCTPGDAFAPQPSRSSEWAIRQAKEATAAAVKAAKDKRIAEAKAAERTAP